MPKNVLDWVDLWATGRYLDAFLFTQRSYIQVSCTQFPWQGQPAEVADAFVKFFFLLNSFTLMATRWSRNCRIGVTWFQPNAPSLWHASKRARAVRHYVFPSSITVLLPVFVEKHRKDERRGILDVDSLSRDVARTRNNSSQISTNKIHEVRLNTAQGSRRRNETHFQLGDNKYRLATGLGSIPAFRRRRAESHGCLAINKDCRCIKWGHIYSSACVAYTCVLHTHY